MPQSSYRIRDEFLPGDAFLVVRGGLLEITTLRADAEAARRRFGTGGVSVFGAGEPTDVEVLARSRMVRFDVLTLVTLGILRAAGLETVPTFKSPHYTIMLPNLEADLRRLLACENDLGEPLLCHARGAAMNYAIDIDIDWNEEDDTGLPWTFVERAAHPEEIVPGAYVLAGRGSAVAVAQVVDRDDLGLVHLRMISGSIARNAHLLARSRPA